MKKLFIIICTSIFLMACTQHADSRKSIMTKPNLMKLKHKIEVINSQYTLVPADSIIHLGETSSTNFWYWWINYSEDDKHIAMADKKAYEEAKAAGVTYPAEHPGVTDEEMYMIAAAQASYDAAHDSTPATYFNDLTVDMIINSPYGIDKSKPFYPFCRL